MMTGLLSIGEKKLKPWSLTAMTFPSVRLGAEVQQITLSNALTYLPYNHFNCILHLSLPLREVRSSQMVLVVKNLPASAGDKRDSGSIPWVGKSPGGGHGNPLQYTAWRIPWTEEPGGLKSMGSQRVRQD